MMGWNDEVETCIPDTPNSHAHLDRWLLETNQLTGMAHIIIKLTDTETTIERAQLAVVGDGDRSCETTILRLTLRSSSHSHRIRHTLLLTCYIDGSQTPVVRAGCHGYVTIHMRLRTNPRRCENCDKNAEEMYTSSPRLSYLSDLTDRLSQTVCEVRAHCASCHSPLVHFTAVRCLPAPLNDDADTVDSMLAASFCHLSTSDVQALAGVRSVGAQVTDLLVSHLFVVVHRSQLPPGGAVCWHLPPGGAGDTQMCVCGTCTAVLGTSGQLGVRLWHYALGWSSPEPFVGCGHSQLRRCLAHMLRDQCENEASHVHSQMALWSTREVHSVVGDVDRCLVLRPMQFRVSTIHRCYNGASVAAERDARSDKRDARSDESDSRSDERGERTLVAVMDKVLSSESERVVSEGSDKVVGNRSEKDVDIQPVENVVSSSVKVLYKLISNPNEVSSTFDDMRFVTVKVSETLFNLVLAELESASLFYPKSCRYYRDYSIAVLAT